MSSSIPRGGGASGSGLSFVGVCLQQGWRVETSKEAFPTDTHLLPGLNPLCDHSCHALRTLVYQYAQYTHKHTHGTVVGCCRVPERVQCSRLSWAGTSCPEARASSRAGRWCCSLLRSNRTRSTRSFRTCLRSGSTTLVRCGLHPPECILLLCIHTHSGIFIGS